VFEFIIKVLMRMNMLGELLCILFYYEQFNFVLEMRQPHSSSHCNIRRLRYSRNRIFDRFQYNYLHNIICNFHPVVVCCVQAEPALMYDAVNVFANSIGSLEGSSNSMQSSNVSCKTSDRWANGTFLYDRLNAVSIRL